MSTMKHTPGPWRVERQNASPTTGEWMIAGANPGYLAEVRDCGSGCAKANARLIAAAPELLAALELAVQHYDEWASAELPHDLDEERLPWLAPARAVIAKAKGES